MKERMVNVMVSRDGEEERGRRTDLEMGGWQCRDEDGRADRDIGRTWEGNGAREGDGGNNGGTMVSCSKDHALE